MDQTPQELREIRRTRREERRALQRVQNVDRARKMHEARTVHGATSHAAKDAAPPLNIGCSGWYYWHWRSIFYPAGLPGKDWFKFYSSRFKTVELNAPFYSWPTIATVKTWLRQAGRRKFVYTIKVNELITHQKKMIGTKELVRDFYHIADLLGDRMGCFLFQFPPSFKYSAASLKRIVGQLDPRYRNVVEFRHRSWWNEKVYAAFRASNLIFCSCSGPRLPDELIRTADDVYLRFHGTSRWYRHDYTKKELIVWADRACASGARHIWGYFNNDREGHAIQNAKAFRRLLSQRLPLVGELKRA